MHEVLGSWERRERIDMVQELAKCPIAYCQSLYEFGQSSEVGHQNNGIVDFEFERC